MKTFLLLPILLSALLLTGCETTIVDHRPAAGYGYGRGSYHGRSHYYTGGSSYRSRSNYRDGYYSNRSRPVAYYQPVRTSSRPYARSNYGTRKVAVITTKRSSGHKGKKHSDDNDRKQKWDNGSPRRR